MFVWVSSFRTGRLDKEKFNMDVPCWDGKFRRHIAAVRVCLMQSRYGFNVLAMVVRILEFGVALGFLA